MNLQFRDVRQNLQVWGNNFEKLDFIALEADSHVLEPKVSNVTCGYWMATSVIAFRTEVRAAA